MDDDVASAQLLASCIAEAKPVAAKVELEHRELLSDQLRERRVAELVLQPLERRAREHLTLEAFGGRTPRAGADGEVDAADVWERSQAFLDDRLAQETRAAGDQYGLAF